MVWNIKLTLFPSLQIKPRIWSAGNYVWHYFEKTKGRGRIVSRTIDYAEATVRMILLIRSLRNFAKFSRKHLCKIFFFDKVRRCRSSNLLKTRFQRRCFLVNFAKFVRTPILQKTTEKLLRIIAVSILVKW